MVEDRISNLDNKYWRIYSVRPETREFVFCSDCSRRGRNGILYQFTDENLVKRRAVESVIEMHVFMREHAVSFVSRSGEIRSLDNLHRIQ